MAQSLATKYRPQTFEECLGQTSILKILERQIETNQIKNCYLFCGPSGTGKTTIGRVLAKKINNGKGTPIEIDAASNNGVDNIRSIVDEAQSRALDAEYKVFIIDECHSITTQGWQAFLKTLEEPPEKTIFMFCTTNPEKVPATIQNRVMRFNLTKVSTTEIEKRLEYICEQENFVNYSESCDYIAKISNGGVRDAIVALEKVSDYSKNISIKNTLEVLGTYSYEDFLALSNDLIDGKEDSVLKILEYTESLGKDLKSFIDQYMSFVLDLIKYGLFKDMSTTKLPQSLEKDVEYAISFDRSISVFNLIVDNLLTLKNNIRYDDNASLTVKATFIHILEEVKNFWKAA